ncbi:hypothetical protein [Yinghuangia soli]|uniref:Uncharacterized protein n=1 Tax=Yinghuangia soli TaxID=2908204 RepID=A0AA41Q2G2_9ACTN|nr:hypothetical protein [Yinghuangia soli]MCF2530313.1 hypothetical protein [Yinghuangia soli]
MLTTLFRAAQAVIVVAVLVAIVMVFDDWEYRATAALAVFGLIATLLLFIRWQDDENKLAGRLWLVCMALWAIAFGIAKFVPGVVLQVAMGAALVFAIVALLVVSVRESRARRRTPA